ncbi:hypothetical protein CTAYLR_009944 [Chrysophaeum taylorii]|uniref:RING-type domain-containing protein n=1 Tax=Chrysophaeum taylorii TaxID=2483200 RepID=A0AAD7UE01_9STRA|nr:hypothetical protein CTAYLR_009944 [Chrysophaeum taylorii]
MHRCVSVVWQVVAAIQRAFGVPWSNASRLAWIWSLEAATGSDVVATVGDEARIFSETGGPYVCARYKWGGWRVGKVRSVDPNDTVTLVWDDGFLQIGTRRRDVRRVLSKVSRRQSTEAPAAAAPAPQQEQQTVFACAKRGDVAGVVREIDARRAMANDVEEIEGRAGRSLLYWACHGGHADLVAALLARGAWDWDKSCVVAVTGNERADDATDLVFDPDEQVFSDFVDYAPRLVGNKEGGPSRSSFEVIRALLREAAKHEPATLYRSSNDDCCVCVAHRADAVAAPCGHVACCESCLRRLRDRRDGCPICRQRIRRILPVVSFNGPQSRRSSR